MKDTVRNKEYRLFEGEGSMGDGINDKARLSLPSFVLRVVCHEDSPMDDAVVAHSRKKGERTI